MRLRPKLYRDRSSTQLNLYHDGKNHAIPSLHRDSFLAKVQGLCPVLSPGNATSLYCRAVISHNIPTMIRNFIIAVLLTISVPIWGQSTSKVDSTQDLDKHVKIDPTYLLLGTLWDYMGRFTYVDKNSQIDRYYPHEKPLMEYLDRMIQKEFNIQITTTPDNQPKVSRYETFSPQLSSIINSFFNKNYLIMDSLKNLPELNSSYLAGRYYRFGRKLNDSIYSIQIANSANYIVCDSLLRRLGCNKIHFKYLNNIPAQFIYYFIPTNDLKRYFNYLMKEKEKLENSYLEYFKTELKISTLDLKTFKEINKKDYTEIIELFKQ